MAQHPAVFETREVGKQKFLQKKIFITKQFLKGLSLCASNIFKIKDTATKNNKNLKPAAPQYLRKQS